MTPSTCLASLFQQNAAFTHAGTLGALAMVMRTNLRERLAGRSHLSFASSATRHDVEAAVFLPGPTTDERWRPDLLQGHRRHLHARAFAEPYLEDQMNNFALGNGRQRPVLVPAPLFDA